MTLDPVVAISSGMEPNFSLNIHDVDDITLGPVTKFPLPHEGPEAGPSFATRRLTIKRSDGLTVTIHLFSPNAEPLVGYTDKNLQPERF